VCGGVSAACGCIIAASNTPAIAAIGDSGRRETRPPMERQ
jgi:hypothetical protein